MPSLIDLNLEGQQVQRHRPWPRTVIDSAVWGFATRQLAERRWSLLSLWGEPAMVHMALFDSRSAEIGVVSLECPDKHFPSVAAHHPPAQRLERSIQDLFGLVADGATDSRPWLDHGQWGVRAPQGEAVAITAPEPPYPFLKVEGEGVHQAAVGPVHAGIIEPGHFRFSVSGETVVRLEQRLGYVHKGTEALMIGADPIRAARLAGRVSGDSTVAYGFAFARAVEAASDLAVPPRAVWLRALCAELERLANHLGDIGGICNDAAFALLLAHFGALREIVLRAAATAFGHRLMRDVIVPGGIARDIDDAGKAAIRAALATIRRQFPELVELYDDTASLQDRTVSTGVLKPELAAQYCAGGFVGRASGRGFDTRRTLAYPPYQDLRFEVPVLQQGDVNARIWIRIREVEQSLSLIDQILDQLPRGPLLAPLPVQGQGEGVALVEGFRGDVLVWLRLRDGVIARCHLRDPSWFQWPLLEAAIEGNIVADFPLCNKSFNCSYSGVDL
ncbi:MULTISPECIES: NADH-quinone oxidoreductase subunit C [Rhodopseudomonas]|uniref:Hydrogenase expression protein HypE n=1 Tax=Rhodopseudomonas palustris TaxID=1076 RepID=A0A0D7E2H4_RHOPL|nr:MULTISPECIES: NADH-quinone oxidoreductase subunit C [Rhodopseudomonas]KIZ33802.1 hydrogenase expression protein HypE [Rhodopseudomonas palustris]MDF3809702.1 NADH-quinone oxidoreductase subunit C [Rhodopseudomonas sp. BAL398]WOK17531.1 NADH-quinone oxidoreductase subunit C [Rhodopseudomonas sp. BAL398]